MQISLLADYPDLAPQLADWFYSEWSDYYERVGQSQADIAAQFKQKCQREAIPLTFIAHENGEPLGVVSLQPESCETHRHLSPWVAGLYVMGQRRHEGIAMALVEAAVEKARELGVETLYIGISHARAQYEARGWQLCDAVGCDGQQVFILKQEFGK